MIDGYTFGQVVVDGKKYTSDLIITAEGILANWWRKSGHELCVEDIRDSLSPGIETLIVGTGAYGMVKILPETKQFLKDKGIELIAQPTKEACETFNRICSAGERDKVVVALHLTC
jgi:hypothetical protein